MKNTDKKTINGIILSPSQDTKFKSMNRETPMPLIKIRGKKLIERQIENLKEAGIEDIIFVINNNRKEYEYLIDKYSIEILDINKKTRGNIEDLFSIKDRLKKSYIVSSTDYISKNIYKSRESYSWYTLIETKRYTKKKVVDTDENNKIIKIKQGGFKKKFLYGSAYLNEEDSKVLKKYLKEYYMDENKKELDWQDILLDHIDEFNIYGKNMDYETIYSFTSLDDLQRINLGLKEDYKKLRDIVANILEVDGKEIKNLRKMETGMTNDSSLFEYKGKEYIVRIPGPGTEEIINRKNEYESYKLIEDLNISDKVIFMNERTGVKITEYEEDSRILDMNNKNEIVEAMNIIRRIHESEFKVDHEFNLPDMIAYYEKLCFDKDIKLLENYDEHRLKINRLINILDKMEKEKVFCHIDPVDENFLLLEDGSMILIDWEYSSMSDPLLDIVMFAVHGNMDTKALIELASIYLKRQPSEEEKIRLYSYMAMSSFLWYLWSEYKEAMGSDYGNYKYNLYAMSEKTYKEINSLLDVRI